MPFFRQYPRSRVPPWTSVLWVFLLVFVIGRAGAAPSVRDDLWVTNGPVYSSVSYGNNTGYSTGAAAALGAITGLLDTSFPKVEGTVNVVIANGTDSWYIGGDFTSVGGIARNNLARINADKSVDVDWDPDADGPVHTLLLVGSTLVVGGEFTHIGGVARKHIAALITTLDSNFVTNWDPDTDDTVLAMSLFGTTLFLGGEFTQVGGQARNHIAAVDANIDACGNTVITEWDPDANDYVRSMVSSSDGTTLYVGGDFTSIGNKTRSHIASLEADAGAAGTLMITPRSASGDTLNIKVTDTDLNTDTGTAQTITVSVVNNATGETETITLTETSSDSCVFSGTLATAAGAAAGSNNDGILNTQAGQILTATYSDASNSDGEAELVTATDTVVANTDEATVWDPDSDDSVYVMLLSNNTLYVGGAFASIGGKNRSNIAALNTLVDINNATQWDPNADGIVHTMIQDSNILYVGGEFTSIGGKTRNHIAVLDIGINTNNATSWNSGLDGPVYGIARASSTIYAGGAFNTATDGSRLYIGGDFTYVGPNNGFGVGIATIAAATPGQASNAFPIVNGPVYAAISDGANGWYIGGAFDNVGGVTRNNIAHIQPSGADYIVEAGWDPNASGTVNALALSSDDATLYVGGSFASIGGENRNNIASLAAADGSADVGWDPNASGTVNALVLSSDDSKLYAGGTFATIGGENRNNIASLAAADGSADVGWDPNASGTVNALALSSDDSKLYAGGTFATIGGGNRNNVAFLAQADGSADSTWNPNANGAVNALALSTDDSTLYIGGDFTSVGGVVRKHVAAISTGASGTPPLTNWVVNAGNSVQTLSLSSDGLMIYAGGPFSSIGGVVRNRIAALDLINGNATSWDPGANNVVRSLVMSADQSKLYVGGDFTVIGGNSRNRIATIDRVSGLATSWNPDADATVHTMLLDDDGTNLYVGGEFTTFNNTTVIRNHIASLATDATNNSTIVNGWNPNPDAIDGAIRTMALFGTTLYVGGDFTVNATIGGENRNHIAALRTTNDTASAWNPNANSNVHDISLSADGRLLYVGGEFTNFDGGTVLRNHVAALDTSTVIITDMVTDWDPDAGDIVRTLALSDDESTVYIGGDFATLGGGAQTRNAIAALAVDDGSPISWWDTDTDGPVYSITVSDDGGSLYTGGVYTQINGDVRSNYAALDVLSPVTRAFPPASAYGAGLSVELICDDGFGSDCAVTYYTTDGSTPTTSSATYSAPVAINADMTIKYFSVDNAGNREEIQTAQYMIETIPPVTVATPSGGLLGQGGNTITLTCTDTGGGDCANTYYTLDGTTPTTSSAVYTDPILLGDDTTLKFFSMDTAGNVESSVNTETYTVDISSPRTTASPTTRVFDTSKLTITLSCDDTPLPETEPGVGDIPEGAVDSSGNFPNPDDFNNPTPGDFATTSAVFITSVVNVGTGCAATYYTTDGTTPTTASTLYGGPFNIRDNTILKFFSVDGAGNRELVKLESYVSHRSNIGMFGPITLWLCLIGIGIRYYFRHPSCR